MPITPIPLSDTLGGVLGFEILELGEEAARGRIPITDRVKQPMGLVHGGAYAAHAEELCSAATFRAVHPEGMTAMGLSNHTSYLRPARGEAVDAVARCRHRGRTTWVWEVDFTDAEGRLCAVTRVTMAVRPAS